MSDINEYFGDIISAYTTDNAIEDGTLIHFEAISPGKWCVTSGVFDAIERKIAANPNDSRTPVQALHNLMSDALGFVQMNKAKIRAEIESGGVLLFCDDFAKHMEGNITGETLWMGGNDTGGFTVMFPHER